MTCSQPSGTFQAACEVRPGPSRLPFWRPTAGLDRPSNPLFGPTRYLQWGSVSRALNPAHHAGSMLVISTTTASVKHMAGLEGRA
jgi:hypothetical protein